MIEETASQHKAQADRAHSGMDVGLLILRVAFGVIFLGHALQKLGWFEGGGYPTDIASQQTFLTFIGYSSTAFLAWVVTLSEAVAGVSLILGALTPIGAAAAMGIMFQGIVGYQWDGGLFGDTNGFGFEFALSFFAGAAAIGFCGAGRFSVDHRLGWSLSGVRIGMLAMGGSMVVGAAVLNIWGVGFGGTPKLPTAPEVKSAKTAGGDISGSKEWCKLQADVSHSLDTGAAISDATWDQFVAAAPKGIKTESATGAAAFKSSPKSAFGQPEVQAAVDKIVRFEKANC